MATYLKHILTGLLPAEELAMLVGSYDVVGDIAIAIIPEALLHREQLIGDAILQSNIRIKVVLKRSGIYGGEFRTIPLQLIAGEARKETEVKEYGLSYMVNPESTYFSVRSGSERKRVASLVTEDETVLVLFSGIGPYPLMISKYGKARKIIGIEKNPEAHQYGLKNVLRNKKMDNIELFLGDVSEVVPKFTFKFDRVIMPLPQGAEEFLPLAIKVLKKEATIHYYQMQKAGCFRETEEQVTGALHRENRKVQSLDVIRCGHCGPKTYRICVDVTVC